MQHPGMCPRRIPSWVAFGSLIKSSEWPSFLRERQWERNAGPCKADCGGKISASEKQPVGLTDTENNLAVTRGGGRWGGGKF